MNQSVQLIGIFLSLGGVSWLFFGLKLLRKDLQKSRAPGLQLTEYIFDELFIKSGKLFLYFLGPIVLILAGLLITLAGFGKV